MAFEKYESKFYDSTCNFDEIDNLNCNQSSFQAVNDLFGSANQFEDFKENLPNYSKVSAENSTDFFGQKMLHEISGNKMENSNQKTFRILEHKSQESSNLPISCALEIKYDNQIGKRHQFEPDLKNTLWGCNKKENLSKNSNTNYNSPSIFNFPGPSDGKININHGKCNTVATQNSQFNPRMQSDYMPYRFNRASGQVSERESLTQSYEPFRAEMQAFQSKNYLDDSVLIARNFNYCLNQDFPTNFYPINAVPSGFSKIHLQTNSNQTQFFAADDKKKQVLSQSRF